MDIKRSLTLYKKAVGLIPGGVNSPVRACRSVGCDPLFIKKGIGCFIYDADGNRYIDYVGSWGPMILGHAHGLVIEAIETTLKQGTSFGAPTELEIELADRITEAFDSVEMVRMVNSGTEATMSAIRLARGYTGRKMVIKFDGCYHGHADMLLVEAGSGVATLRIPGSPGVPEETVKYTISLPYNDLDKVEETMKQIGDETACIIVEPVAGNMGLVRPEQGFLEGLRELTLKYGALLIFDEVMTGFRVCYGGVQKLHRIEPDLTCLGKVIGGGLPVGAYGGRRDIMSKIAPAGEIYQAGTLSGNPVAMAAGIATLDLVSHPGFYEAIEEKADLLIKGLKQAAKKAGIPVQADRAGSMLGLFFTDRPVKDFDDAKSCDLKRYSAYYRMMRERGVYIAPSQFEAFFISSAHNMEHIEKTIEAAEEAMASF